MTESVIRPYSGLLCTPYRLTKTVLIIRFLLFYRSVQETATLIIHLMNFLLKETQLI